MEKSYVRSLCKVLTPIYVPGETYSFYINFDNPITDPNFNNFKLCLYDTQGAQVLNNIGILQKDVLKNILYNIFSIFEMPGGVTDGYYVFGIWDSVNNILKCTSNKILLINSDEYKKNTALVSYRHNRNFYGFDYTNLLGFYQTFRLPFIEIDYQYDVDRTQYRNVSNKELRNLIAYVDKVVKIESYYFDEDAHDAAAIMYEHKELYIDGIQYVPKEAYQVIQDELSNNPKGSIDCYKVLSNKYFEFTPAVRTVTDQYDYLVAYFNDSRITYDLNGHLVFTDSRLVGKVNYGIYSTQIPNFIDQSQIQYNQAGGSFTILIDSFSLVGTGKLYIFINLLDIDPAIFFTA